MQESQPESRSRVFIIIVCSDPDEREVLARCIDAVPEPNHIVIVENNNEAHRVLGRIEDTDDLRLLWLDHHLAHPGTMDLLRQLRAHSTLCNAPVIIWSRKADSTTLHHAIEAGANAFLLKPADQDAFKETVEAVLGFWATINIAAPPLSSTLDEARKRRDSLRDNESSHH